jgi:flagellin-like hook-associated protein FlgL
MVINTNMTGTGGTPLAKSNARLGSNSKAISPSDNPSGVAGASTLDSQASRILANAGSDIQDSNAARESTQLARAGILRQSATAMLAQANLSPETVFNLLQG